jgi:DNA-binding NarL/FixJ family response regulator
MNTYKASILLVEDHLCIGDVLTKSLELLSYCVCCRVTSRQDIIAEHERADADLVLMNLALCDKSSLVLLGLIRDFNHEIPVLCYTTHEEDLVCAERAWFAGARGYIGRNEGLDELEEALDAVANGEVYLNGFSKEMLVRMTPRSARRPVDPLKRLSNREYGVLLAMGRGFSCKETAIRLDLSPKTVETYRTRIRKKLCLPSGDLYQYAMDYVRHCGQHGDIVDAR